MTSTYLPVNTIKHPRPSKNQIPNALLLTCSSLPPQESSFLNMTSSSGDSDWVYNADWGLSTAAGDGLTVDGDWILAGVPFSPPRHHLTGFFLIESGRHTYVPLLRSSDSSVAADDLISSIPISASICSSTQGIVLARAPWSSYYISTPISPKWTRIPNPIFSHPISIPIALIAGDGDGFLIICAVPSADGPLGFHRFDIYESRAGKWRIGPDRFPTGRILPSSGVSCGGAVYFRTEAPSVVAYDDASGVARVLPPPPRCWGSEVRWELAEGNGRLRCVCVRGRVVEVFELGERDRWSVLERSEGIACSDSPLPLRVEGGGVGVVLWVNGRVGRWDLEAGRAIGLGSGEVAAPPPGSRAEYVPCCAAPELRRW